MSDEQFLLQSRPPSWWTRIKLERVLSGAALCIALAAALFSYLQYRAAERQADIAEQARKDAKQASAAQAKDAERSRIAAEISAEAARLSAQQVGKLVDVTGRSVDVARQTMLITSSGLRLQNRPYLTARIDKITKMYVNPNDLSFTIDGTIEIKNLGNTTARQSIVNFHTTERSGVGGQILATVPPKGSAQKTFYYEGEFSGQNALRRYLTSPDEGISFPGLVGYCDDFKQCYEDSVILGSGEQWNSDPT